ncbi:MAG TPA: hypothetical protein VN967_13735 [Burkholderiales bacterium]|nr:hypothetical protein [Burkholderiales bacterium]
MSGAESISRSSCVCASMKPGAAILPAASIYTCAFELIKEPMEKIFPEETPISASKRGARVPSTTVAFRIRSSNFI